VTQSAWGPPRWTAGVLAVVAVALVGLAVGVDGPGRVLLAIAVLAALYAAGWLLGGPALAADSAGVRVRGASRSHQVPWSEVHRVLVDARRRSRAVELETDDGLLAVPALLLGGVSPAVVAARLERLRTAPGDLPGDLPAPRPTPPG
jgi:hypothetical protein